MKKSILLLFSFLSIVFASNAQYNGCEFTAQPDSSCIILNTWNYDDTLELTKGVNSTSSYKKLLVDRFFVRSWKKSNAVSTTKINKSVIVSDHNGQTFPMTIDTLKNWLAIPVNPALTYNYAVSRTVNSASFTPSSTKACRVTYNVSISCTATIGSASSGKVELQYYNGSIWVTVNEISNSNTVTLAIVLNSINVQTVSVTGEFAPNTQLRLVPTVVGSTTITYIRGIEILY